MTAEDILPNVGARLPEAVSNRFDALAMPDKLREKEPKSALLEALPTPVTALENELAPPAAAINLLLSASSFASRVEREVTTFEVEPLTSA